MAVDLAQLIPSLQREINPPGSNVLEDMTPSQIIGYLADAFWEARLDGFLTGWSCDPAGQVTPVESGGDELGRADQALIVLYAGVKILRNQILNTKTAWRAKAGPVEYEYQSSATMLAEMLKQLKDTKARLQEYAGTTSVSSTVDAFDRLCIMTLPNGLDWC